MKTKLPVLILLTLLSVAFARAQDADQLRKWVNEAIKAGGGEVVIPPGTYTLPRGLFIKDAKKLRLIGTDRERCILKLPPVAFAECAQDTAAGSHEIPVARAQNIAPGMKLWIEAPGEVVTFTQKPADHHFATVQSVEPNKIILTAPLKFPVPAKTHIRHADAGNIIEIRGASEDIQIRNLTLDGGRTADDPAVIGHAQLGAVFVAGPYNYEKGPTGPPVKNIAIQDCVIRNCFGRGIALYSVEGARVERCTITDTNDEAVDFDHYTTKGEARDNQIARCRVAFELNDANDTLITANEVRDCGIGVNLWRWCPQEGFSQGNRIINNVFLNIAGNGVQLGERTRKNSVVNNEIAGCGKNGIVARGEEQQIEGNRIRDVKGKPTVP